MIDFDQVFIRDIKRIENPCIGDNRLLESSSQMIGATSPRRSHDSNHAPHNFTDDNSFSMIFTSGKLSSKTNSPPQERIDIIPSSQKDFHILISILNYLIRESNLKSSSDPTSLLIMKYWMSADVNADGHLDMKEVTRLLSKLNMELPIKVLRQ